MRDTQALRQQAESIREQDLTDPERAGVQAAAHEVISMAYSSQQGQVSMELTTLRAIIEQAFLGGHAEARTGRSSA